MGRALAAFLNRQIDQIAGEDGDRAQVMRRMGTAAGIDADTVRNILTPGQPGFINCPPPRRLRGFARALNVSFSSVATAARRDGCNTDEQDEQDSS